MEVYRTDQSNWPENARETVIAGGNHAQFGDYGPQKGDGAAEISGEAQQTATVDAVCTFFG